MRFPRTYVDAGRGIFEEWKKQFIGDATGWVAQDSRGKLIVTTGTTVVAILSADKKIGVIASDGRVSGGTFSMKEDFPKVFDCRLGFVGFAGVLTLVQRIMPAFRAELDNICDSRHTLISASGAVRRLFLYYLAAGAMPEGGGLDIVPLFWDKEDGRCHLYRLAGLCRLSCDHAVVIGSGSAVAGMNLINKFPPTNSREELVNYARNYIREASQGGDTGTNLRMFCGIIDHGNFEEGN